jgi:hypothetical protein
MRSAEILKRSTEGIKESNKVLIKELIQDLEEKGISPVIAINGVVKKLILLGAVQLKSFEQELKKFGMKKTDFCLLQEVTTNKSDARNIILVHKKSAKLKTYKTQNKSWVSDLHYDLETKFFIS